MIVAIIELKIPNKTAANVEEDLFHGDLRNSILLESFSFTNIKDDNLINGKPIKLFVSTNSIISTKFVK